MVNVGMIFPPLAPERLLPVARAADAAGLERLWVWEDCFNESGVAAAAAVLGATDRLGVGIGLLPVPLRNVALTAMEIATIERLFPRRLLPGIGHGVLDWMGQAGVRAASPVTLLGEYATALRGLMLGETVTTSGRYVHLHEVALAYPPAAPPPLLVGAVGDKTVQVAGAAADGVIVIEGTAPERVSEIEALMSAARADAGRAAESPARISVFMTAGAGDSAEEVAARVSAYGGAGATDVAVLAEDAESVDLIAYAAFVAREVAPRVC